MNTKYLFLIPIVFLSLIPTFLYVFGASVSTIDQSGRREYTYCPLSDSDIKSINGEIDGCPLARVYVNNWNNLSPLEQQTIDTILRSKGFVDSGEHIIK